MTGLDREKFKYSIVVPVYNSAEIVGDTVDRISEFFTEHGLDHELILVNDGSTDGSWDVIAEKARDRPRTSSPSTCCGTTASTTPTWPGSARRPATTSSPWTTTCRTRPTRRCC